MSNTSNESPAHQPNELPLSPSAYYDSIPLTAQLPLNVAREILREATIRHEEEPLPVSPRTGVNILHNSNCTMEYTVEVAEPGGYYLKNVLFTQYFTSDGASIHYNYWSSNWGYAGSHGCLGVAYNESKFAWDWADVGTPVYVFT